MGEDAAGLVFVAVLMTVVSGVVVWSTKAAATGRMRRNGAVGIRIPSTMRSDAAWRAGHAAALRPMTIVAVVNLVLCGALLAVAFSGHASSVSWLGVVPAVVLLVGLVPAVRAATAAANAAPDDGE